MTRLDFTGGAMMRAQRVAVLFTTVALAFPLPIAAWADGREEKVVPQNHVCEWTFQAEKAASIEGVVELDAVFKGVDGRTLRVPAFWAGEHVWKVRFAWPVEGTFTFETECSDRSDSGLHGQRGSVTVTPYEGVHALYRHGPLRVGNDRRHFEHADGKPFFWLGDTWWMGLSKRLHWPDDFQALAADRKQKGFTVVQIVGGLPPDMIPLDPRGAGDGGQAWTDDFGRIRPEFYNAADKRIEHLVDQGLIPCIVSAWKNYLPVLGPEKMKRHWRNLIARYAAYPIVWILGGEINQTTTNARFLGEFDPVLNTDEAGFRKAWTEIAGYLRQTDAFDRIVGAHNQIDYHVLDDPKLLDIYFLQSGHSALVSISTQLQWFDELSRAEHRAPLVLGEANYQDLFNKGSYGDQLQRHQFWATMLAGGAGHTYGANGIWQVNQPDKPFGPSPHGFVWGNTPWPEAMRHKASTQIGLGKAFLQQIRWTELVPSSELVRFADQHLPPLDSSGVKWIWTVDGKSGTRLIGTTFDLPKEVAIRNATLRLACKGRYGLSLNGQSVHRIGKLDLLSRRLHADQWLFPLAGEYLQPGRNILMLRFDKDDFVLADGLLAHLHVEFSDGSIREIFSDESWRWTQPRVGWPGDVLKLDPSEFETTVANVGASQPDPASIEFQEIDTYGPRCASIADQLWLIYTPAAVPVELVSLGANREYRLETFNPRTGELSESKVIRSDGFGRWQWRPPKTAGDWVLVVKVAQ